ncbi:MAG: HlyD family type I secretion periplasmic adaptor subunit [Xanthobacteraceae bacterium]
MIDNSSALRGTIRRLNLTGLVVLAVFLGVGGGWVAFAELSGAVIASGFIVVESNVKKVQHPTGGIVGQIFVKQGSLVEEGQILVRLDETVPRATLGIVQSQLDELRTRQARLTAERDRSDSIIFPEDLVARQNERTIATAIAGETTLFESRKAVHVGQRSQLRERIAQINEEVRGLSSQRDAKLKEIGLIGEELKGVTDLYKKNLVSIMRYMALQRDQTKLQGEHGQLVAEIARARGRISETELQRIQIDRDFRSEVLRELRDIEGKIPELKERLTTAEDQLKRVDIRAPQAGKVHELTVHTIGGVIGAGETIMLIVPRTDNLVVEARVSPSDIDQISLGAAVTVRIMAGNQRTTPDVMGSVTHISADLTREQGSGLNPGQVFFMARISLNKDSVRALGDLHLVPGMPAETFIETGLRTPLDYLIKPLTEQLARTMRER